MPNVLPQMIKVVSSNLDSIGFNEKEHILYVKFLSSSVYEYRGVSKNIFKAFLKSSSKGKFFAKEIRPKYTSLII